MFAFISYIILYLLQYIPSSESLPIAFTLPKHTVQATRWLAPTWADTLKSTIPFNSENIEMGRRIYFRQCVVCHGNNGKGDGESGFGLDVPPGDLTDAFTITERDGSIFWKISYGREPMPQFNTKLTEKERWQLVAWLRNMQQNQPIKHKYKKK